MSKTMLEIVTHVLNSNTKLIPFLVSPPGVGKTAFARELAEHYRTDVFVYNCASLDETDFGFPDKTPEGLVFLPPAAFKAGIILFDEIDRVNNPSVTNTLLSAFRDRAVNGNKITGKIIAAGNQEHDQACNILDVKSAFADRLLRINFSYSPEQRRDYLRTKHPGNVMARWAGNNLDLLVKFTPRRVDEAILVGPEFIDMTLDSATAVIYNDFLNKRLSVEEFLTGDHKIPENVIVASSLAAELFEKVESWVSNDDHVKKVQKLFDGLVQESKMALIEELKFQVKNGKPEKFLEAVSNKMPSIYKLYKKA